MGLPEHLNSVNPMPVLPVESEQFRTYGRIIEGFRAMVMLPRGTTTPLERDGRTAPWDSEEKLLLMRNKWILAHPQREVLIRQGAFPGLLGENRQLLY